MLNRLKAINWWNVFLALLVIATVTMWACERSKEPPRTSDILF